MVRMNRISRPIPNGGAGGESSAGLTSMGNQLLWPLIAAGVIALGFLLMKKKSA